MYEIYPSLVRVQLDLTPGASGGGLYDGTIRLEPLVDGTRTPMGVTAISVHYDSQMRTLEIKPTSAAYSDMRGVRLPTLFGVFDEEQQAFGGVIVGVTVSSSSPYFVLARPDKARKRYFKPLRQVAKDAKPGGRLPSFGGGGISRKKFLDWSMQLASEYPDIDFYRTESNTVLGMSRSLFRDGNFQPYFGKKFDKLKRGEREGNSRVVQKIPAPRANFPEERAAGVAHGAARAFSSFRALDTTLTVYAFRHMDAWRSQSLARMEKLGTNRDALIAIDALAQSEEKAFLMYWPSERAAFSGAMQASRTRIVGPILSEIVDQLVATASGAKGLAALARARTSGSSTTSAGGDYSVGTLMALVDESTRARESEKLNAALDNLLTKETRTDTEAIGRFGGGLNSLQVSAEWNTQMARKYGSFLQYTPVQVLFGKLRLQRESVFGAVEPELTGRINSAGSTREIDQLRTTYFGVVSDKQIASASRMLRVAQDRRTALQEQETSQRAEQAARQRYENSPCASVRDASEDPSGGPSGELMCRIIESGFTAADQLNQEMKDSCAHVDRNDMGAAYVCLFGQLGGVGGGPQLKIGGFRKHWCKSAQPHGYEGYICEYTMKIISGNELTRSIIGMIPATVNTERFVETPLGWYRVQL